MAETERERLLRRAMETGATSTNAFSKALGIPRTNLRRMIDRNGADEALKIIYAENAAASVPPVKTRITRTGTAAGETIESKGTSITSLDQLLEAADVDLTTWQVKNYTINSWDSGERTNFQVKAQLERVPGVSELAGLKAATIEAMREHAPAAREYLARPRPDRPQPGLAMEVSVPDLHLGKLAHAEETGANYDGKIAVRAFQHVLREFIDRAYTLGVERFIFPVGNDLLHVDGSDNETTAGTPQDVDTRWYRSVKRAQELMVEAIDAMVSIAPVDIVIVPGNHARIQEAMLGQIIGAWYRNDERVTVHDAPTPRQYIRHGSTLLGFTHGDGIKPADLPLLMATEVPGEWAATEHRVFSIGHTHSRKSDKFGSVTENKGVEVRTSPSLSASDSWHVSKGYVGNLRAAEAYVHDARAGEIARFRASIPADFE